MIAIQPTVLLQVADHYHKVAGGTENRVVGVLMGTVQKKGEESELTVTNSYPVPFEEDRNDQTVWYFDRIYAAEMYRMIHRVNSLEVVVGFYSTAQEVVACDKNIADIVTTLGCPEPILILVDIKPNATTLATCYRYDPYSSSRHWTHIGHKMVPLEIEKVAISYLIRQSRLVDNYTGALSEGEITLKETSESLAELYKHLKSIRDYVANIGDRLTVYDQKILDQVSDLCASWASAKNNSSSLAKDLINPAVETLRGCIERCIVSVDNLATNRETGM